MFGRPAALAAVAIVASCAVGFVVRAPFAAPRRDPHPLPAEPLRVSMSELGTHGGRLGVAHTSPPTTNPLVAHETPTTDVTSHLYVSLVGFDCVSHQMTPGLATSWERSADGLAASRASSRRRSGRRCSRSSSCPVSSGKERSRSGSS